MVHRGLLDRYHSCRVVCRGSRIRLTDLSIVFFLITDETLSRQATEKNTQDLECPKIASHESTYATSHPAVFGPRVPTQVVLYRHPSGAVDTNSGCLLIENGWHLKSLISVDWENRVGVKSCLPRRTDYSRTGYLKTKVTYLDYSFSYFSFGCPVFL